MNNGAGCSWPSGGGPKDWSDVTKKTKVPKPNPDPKRRKAVEEICKAWKIIPGVKK